MKEWILQQTLNWRWLWSQRPHQKGPWQCRHGTRVSRMSFDWWQGQHVHRNHSSSHKPLPSVQEDDLQSEKREPEGIKTNTWRWTSQSWCKNNNNSEPGSLWNKNMSPTSLTDWLPSGLILNDPVWIIFLGSTCDMAQSISSTNALHAGGGNKHYAFQK